MLYRLTALAIIAFWFVMTFLLVRDEVSPDASRLREVPASLVLKNLYLHEQPSDLTIYNGPTSIGSVRFHPRVDRENDTRIFEVTGDLHLALGADQRTRFNWLGLVEMTPAYDIIHSRWSATITDPGYLRADIETPKGSQTAHFTLRTRDRVINEGDLPTGQNALSGIAQQLSLGANLDALVKQGANQKPPTIHARRSTLQWRGDKTDTYLVTVEQDGQMIIEAHISQLGQMLMARTVLGYTLRSSDLIP